MHRVSGRWRRAVIAADDNIPPEHDLGQAPLGARLRTDGELHLGYVRDLAHPPDRPVRVLYLVTRPLAQNVEYLACASPERRGGQNDTTVNAQVLGDRKTGVEGH